MVHAGILRTHGIVRVLVLALQFVELLALVNRLASGRQEFLQLAASAGKRAWLGLLFLSLLRFLLVSALHSLVRDSDDWMNRTAKWWSAGVYFAEMASAGWCTLPRMFRGTRGNRA